MSTYATIREVLSLYSAKVTSQKAELLDYRQKEITWAQEKLELSTQLAQALANDAADAERIQEAEAQAQTDREALVNAEAALRAYKEQDEQEDNALLVQLQEALSQLEPPQEAAT
ncbi:MAG: hypothetical protein HC908_08990 [Calothrix sp. SM1_7_51]|nr:hypothetical protein [Calothrix sp. SM1_7_51]